MQGTTCTSHVLRSELLGLSNLPVHQWDGASIGHCFFFEQRYWLEALQIEDQVGYRKREKTSGYVDKCMRSWRLASCTFVRGGSVPGTNTNLMNSSLLIAWLFSKIRHFEQGRDVSRCRLAARSLQSIFSFVAKTVRSADELPHIQVQGIDLAIMADGTIDLGCLLPSYPTLKHEWQALQTSAITAQLGPYPPSNRAPLGDLLTFAEARVHYSEEQGDGQWIVSFRNALLSVVAWATEIGVWHTLAAEVRPAQKLTVGEVWGKTKKRQARQGVLTKAKWIQAMFDQDGSPETILRALTGSKGYAGVVRNVSKQPLSV